MRVTTYGQAQRCAGEAQPVLIRPFKALKLIGWEKTLSGPARPEKNGGSRKSGCDPKGCQAGVKRRHVEPSILLGDDAVHTFSPWQAVMRHERQVGSRRIPHAEDIDTVAFFREIEGAFEPELLRRCGQRYEGRKDKTDECEAHDGFLMSCG